jgi:UDP-glucuronate 4-epimerase
MPFGEDQGVGHPLSLYAATKRSNELMAHSYAHLYGLPCTGLRFFTVYGPWGRPDMALFKFTRAILEGQPIDVYNQGEMQRDFTYVDDIVEGILRVAETLPTVDPTFDATAPRPHPGASGVAPFRVYNIGRGAPVQLMTYIRTLEAELGREAVCNFLPLQAGDVPATFADTSALEAAVGYRPMTAIETGIARFVEWYRDYYGV